MNDKEVLYTLISNIDNVASRMETLAHSIGFVREYSINENDKGHKARTYEILSILENDVISIGVLVEGLHGLAVATKNHHNEIIARIGGLNG